QEVLLGAVLVVQPVRLARPEDVDVHAELRERCLPLALERGRRAEGAALPPGRVGRVHDEPAAVPGDEAVLGPLQACLVGHQLPVPRLGRSSPWVAACSIASAYPASACRMTPVPGSVVSTRSSRSAASSDPSATTTMPAWIELPIPTPPPWWTLTQVAPAATF